MASASNEASSLDEVLRTAVEEICAHTGWPVGHAYVRTVDDGGGLVSSGIWHLEEPERFAALQRGEQAGMATATSASAEAATDDGIDNDRLQVLRRMGPTDRSLLRQMVEAFAAEAPENIASLNQASSSGDAERLRQGAHRLRGAAGNLGAGVASLCADLEALAETGSLRESADLLTRLGAELHHAVARLRGSVGDEA